MAMRYRDLAHESVMVDNRFGEKDARRHIGTPSDAGIWGVLPVERYAI
jgi:hypothetical protein